MSDGVNRIKLEFDSPDSGLDSKEHYAIFWINKIAKESNIFNIKVSVDDWEDIKTSRYCNCENCQNGFLGLERKSLESIAEHYENIGKPNPYAELLAILKVRCMDCKHFVEEKHPDPENYSCYCELKIEEDDNDPLVTGDRYFNDEHDCKQFKFKKKKK